MPHPIEPSILRILHPNGKTVGTGFLVAANLAVTCAHVVVDAGAIEGDTIQVQFAGQAVIIKALVLPAFWSSADKDDIAVLKLDQVSEGLKPLHLGAALTCRAGSSFYSFGYTSAAEEQGLGTLGKIITLAPGSQFLQLSSEEAFFGISGAPVYDEQRKVVVGMINKGHVERQFSLQIKKLSEKEVQGKLITDMRTGITYATPTETIWKVCPQLKPLTPVLPRRNPIVDGINLLPYDYDQHIQNFLTEYMGTDSHPVPFGGRDDALHMLDNWLAETTPYLLLAAPAGRGKSALLVRWLDSLKEREDLALAFVPVSIRFGTNMERVFYAALAARLAYLHGDEVPASPETSTAVYRGLVSDYLSKPLANGRTLLVVLDGLDEAADWQAGADFMPSELPAGVRVVVSARFLAGDADSTPWLRRLNWERNDLASAPTLVPLDREGVRDVLFKMGCPLDELSRNVDIVAELYRLSEGDPLLVGLYVGDLWAKGAEVTRLKPNDLAGIQPGYKGYFDRWWDDQKKLWGKDKPWLEKHVRAVRNLLSGALGPLFLADIHSLDPDLESDFLDDALDILRRFIIGDNQTQGYTFSHPKLGQYFWDALTQTEQEQVEKHFLAWGEQTLQEFIDGKRDPKKRTEVPAYIVHNYGLLLARAKQPIEKWLPLIHHQQWAHAWFTVEGAYGGYLQDVQGVWEQCKLIDRQTIFNKDKVPYIGNQVRCALIEAGLHSLASNISPELIALLVKNKTWSLSQAWAFILQMPKPNQQANAIIAFIPHIDNEQLSECFARVRIITDEWTRSRILCVLIGYLPIDELFQAVDVVEQINDIEKRLEVMSAIAKRLPKKYLGQILEDVLTIADKRSNSRADDSMIMFDPFNLADVLSILAKRLPEEQFSNRILEGAMMMDGGYERALILTSLAGHKSDLILEALKEITVTYFCEDRIWSNLADVLSKDQWGPIWKYIQQMPSDRNRAEVLSILVERFPVVADEALILVRTIQDQELHVSLLSDLARRLPESQLGQMLTDVRQIVDKEKRIQVLSILVERLPLVTDETIELVRTIQDQELHAILLSDLARRVPDGHLGQVLIEARNITDEKPRARVLVALASRLPELTREALELELRLNDKGQCAEVLSILAEHLPETAWEALEAVWSTTSYDWINYSVSLKVLTERLLKVIAKQFSESEIRQMFEYKNVLTNSLILHKRWCDLASHLPEAKLIPVLNMAQTIKSEYTRTELLSRLAKRLPEGELLKLIDDARKMNCLRYRAKLLSALAGRLPEVSIEAFEAVQAINDKAGRAYLLSELVMCLPEGELGKVWEIARTIKHEEIRAHLLNALAERLPEAVSEALDFAQGITEESIRARSLSDLAKHLPQTQLELVLAAALKIQNEENRAGVLIYLAEHFQERQLGKVLAAVRAIQNEKWRARILSILVGRFSVLIGEALAVTRKIDDENRAEILVDLIGRMHQGELSLLLEDIRAISNVQTRAWVLSVLAGRVSDVIGEALKVATCAMVKEERRYFGYRESNNRFRVLKALAEPIIRISSQESYSFLETVIPELAKRTRSNLFSDLACLMPVLVHLGTKDTPREIYAAVRDVTTWWP